MSKALGKLIVILGLFALMTVLWYQWSGDTQRQGFVDLASGKRLIVVNVLDVDQYKDCHIKGSINVPFDKLDNLAQNLDHDTELVFYCSNYMCAGSGKAAKLFQQKGFRRVWAYEAGMAEWYTRGLPVEGACKASYLKMKNDPIEDQPVDDLTISTEDLKIKLGL